MKLLNRYFMFVIIDCVYFETIKMKYPAARANEGGIYCFAFLLNDYSFIENAMGSIAYVNKVSHTLILLIFLITFYYARIKHASKLHAHIENPYFYFAKRNIAGELCCVCACKFKQYRVYNVFLWRN